MLNQRLEAVAIFVLYAPVVAGLVLWFPGPKIQAPINPCAPDEHAIYTTTGPGEPFCVPLDLKDAR